MIMMMKINKGEKMKKIEEKILKLSLEEFENTNLKTFGIKEIVKVINEKTRFFGLKFYLKKSYENKNLSNDDIENIITNFEKLEKKTKKMLEENKINFNSEDNNDEKVFFNFFPLIPKSLYNPLYFYLEIIKIKNLNNGLYLVENYAKTSVISQNFEENITYELESDKVFNYKKLLEFLFENNFQEFTEETLLIFLRRIYKKFKEKNKELKEIELIPYEVKDLSNLSEDYKTEKHKYIEEKIESLNNKKENIKILNKIKEDEIDEEIEKLEKSKKVLSYYDLDDFDEYKKSYK